MGIVNWLKGLSGNTLFYPGCLTKGILKEEFESYKEIFNKLGIDYILLGDSEVCCGLPVLNAGYRKDAKKLAEKNFKLFKEKGIRKIITSCPSCYHTFREIYSKLVRDWDIEVEHATVSVLNALIKKRIDFKGNEEDRILVGYHDPCHLGRYSGIIDEPREVIERLGGRIIETRRRGRDSFCCGGGGGLRSNFSKVSKDIARERVSQFSPKVEKIISPCGMCHSNLNSASEKSVEFSTFVIQRLRRVR